MNGGIYNLRTEGTGFTGITDYNKVRLVLLGSSVGNNGSNAGSNSNPQVNRTGVSLVQLSNNFYWVILPVQALYQLLFLNLLRGFLTKELN